MDEKQIKFVNGSLEASQQQLDDLLELVAKTAQTEASFYRLISSSNLDKKTKEWLLSYGRTTEELPIRSFVNKSPSKNEVNKPPKSNITQESIQTLISQWSFNVFNHSLDDLDIFIEGMFERFDCFHEFNINKETFYRFLKALRNGYKPNPFHNWLHAIDVTQTLFYFLIMGGSKFFSNLEIFAMLVSGLCHDLEHPGLTNSYLISSRHFLSLRYNDISVLENYHCSQAFIILNDPKTNIFENLSPSEYRQVRKVIISCILATDMTDHFNILARFNTLMESHAKKDPSQWDDTSKKTLYQTLVHLADISNAFKPFPLSERWSNNICEEFFAQGDLEKLNGYPQTPNTDRETTNQAKMSVSFIDFIVSPMLNVLSNLIPLECYCEQITLNRGKWQERLEEVKTTELWKTRNIVYEESDSKRKLKKDSFDLPKSFDDPTTCDIRNTKNCICSFSETSKIIIEPSTKEEVDLFTLLVLVFDILDKVKDEKALMVLFTKCIHQTITEIRKTSIYLLNQENEIWTLNDDQSIFRAPLSKNPHISKVIETQQPILNNVDHVFSYYVVISFQSVYGAIEVQKKRGITLTENESKFLQILGKIAGIYCSYLKEAASSREEIKSLNSFVNLYQKSLRQLSSEMDILKLTKSIMFHARELVNAERCNIFLIDKETNTLWSPIPHGGEEEFRYPISGLVEKVIRTGRIYSQCSEGSSLQLDIDSMTGFKSKSVLCTPIRNLQDEVIGVIEMINKKEGEFTKQDEAQIQILSNYAGIYVNNIQFLKEMYVRRKKVEELLVAVSSKMEFIDLKSLLSMIIYRTREVLEADRGSFFLVNPVMKKLYAKSADGIAEGLEIDLGKGIAGYVAQTGNVLNIEDAYNDPRFNPEVDKLTGYRTKSILCVPVLHNGEVFAVIQMLNKKRNSFFTSDDEELMNVIALQTGAILHNCRLYNAALESNKKLQYKNDSIMSISSAFSADLEINSVVCNMIQKAKHHIGADRCNLYIVQGNYLISKISDGGGDCFSFPIGVGIAGHVANTGEMLNISDVEHDPRFYGAMDLKTGYHTYNVLCVPISTDQKKVLGVIELVNKPGGFTKEDEEIFLLLAKHTSIAYSNSQLYEEALDAQNKIKVLLDVTTALTSELETHSVINTIMTKAKDLLDADRCTLFMVDHERSELWSTIASESKEIRLPLNMGISGHVVSTKIPMNIIDAYECPYFNKKVDIETGYRTKSVLCVPVMNTKGTVIGVMQMLNKKKNGEVVSFTEQDQALLKAFSSQTAVAIENAQLYSKTLEANNYLKSVLKSLSSSQSVITLNNKGQLVTSNRQLEPMTGVPEEVMKKTSYKEWLGLNELFVENISDVYLGNKSFCFLSEYEVKVPGKKKTQTISYHIEPLIDAQNLKNGVVIVISDITETKRILTTLGRTMAPEVATKLLEGDGERLVGVRQKMTVMFSDIRSFTAISENKDPKEVVEFLNEYFTDMVEVIIAENGILDKYIGDAIMAVFGATFTKPDDAIRCCRAALRMEQVLKTFNEKMISRKKDPIGIGIGIHTGMAVSGNIGSPKRFDYTCIGDSVNLASRIEGVTKYYGITTIITQDTYDDVRDHFIVREIDSIRVVGKREPITIYQLIASSDEKDSILQETWDLLCYYEQGLKEYRARNFAEAISAFEKIPQDKTAQIMKRRCGEYLMNPPPADWNCVYDMRSK